MLELDESKSANLLLQVGGKTVPVVVGGGVKDEEPKLSLLLKQQLEKQPELGGGHKEDGGGGGGGTTMTMTTSITTTVATTPTGNNNSLIDSRGCAKPQKKLYIHSTSPLVELFAPMLPALHTWEGWGHDMGSNGIEEGGMPTQCWPGCWFWMNGDVESGDACKRECNAMFTHCLAGWENGEY